MLKMDHLTTSASFTSPKQISPQHVQPVMTRAASKRKRKRNRKLIKTEVEQIVQDDLPDEEDDHEENKATVKTRCN